MRLRGHARGDELVADAEQLVAEGGGHIAVETGAGEAACRRPHARPEDGAVRELNVVPVVDQRLRVRRRDRVRGVERQGGGRQRERRFRARSRRLRFGRRRVATLVSRRHENRCFGLDRVAAGRAVRALGVAAGLRNRTVLVDGDADLRSDGHTRRHSGAQLLRIGLGQRQVEQERLGGIRGQAVQSQRGDETVLPVVPDQQADRVVPRRRNLRVRRQQRTVRGMIASDHLDGRAERCRDLRRRRRRVHRVLPVDDDGLLFDEQIGDVDDRQARVVGDEIGLGIATTRPRTDHRGRCAPSADGRAANLPE